MSKIFLKKDTEAKIKDTVRILKKNMKFNTIGKLYFYIDNEKKIMTSNKLFNNDIKDLCDYLLKDIK